MLARVVIENFLSFREETEFNMFAGNFKTHKSHVYDLPVNLLRSAAIYGANGAGKSNLIKAIEYLKFIVYNGGIKSSINTKKFKLDKDYLSKPVFFEIELMQDKKFYSYGIKIDGTTVLEEWLYETGNIKEDKLIFHRTSNSKGKTKITTASKFVKSAKNKLLIELLEENLLKSNELLLSKDSELKFDIVTSFKAVLLENIVIIHPQSKYKNLTPHISVSDEFKVFSNSLLKTFDTGVEELKIEEFEFDKYFGEDDEDTKEEILADLDDNAGVLIYHKGCDLFVTKNDNEDIVVRKLLSQHIDKDGNYVSFDLEEESDGTQRLLDFIPAFSGVLNEKMTFIIDEIDQSLHPALLKALITKVMNEPTTKGQLIFTTHESNLLDLDVFRQDEIWFVEKDNELKCSRLYSLSDFKPRYDLDIRRGYLKGRFGGIPFLANLEELNWSEYEQS